MSIVRELILVLVLILVFATQAVSQRRIAGTVVDYNSRIPLAYVNIGIKGKNVGVVSKEDGSFIIVVPRENQNDSLKFSAVGYLETSLAVENISTADDILVELKEKIISLREVEVAGEKLVEKRYGIRRRGLVHFTDGIFKKDDSFEIGQVIKLGSFPAHITSINLHINASRPDSAMFRINFYRYDADENIPGERLVEKSIIQRHAIKEGWLKFDLAPYDIFLSGNVLAAIEFIPETEKDVKQILYEVKIGGSSRSFCRKTSLGQWTRPPHHYCLYVTAITDKNAPDDPDEEETPPTFTMRSDYSDEPFSLFVRLPKSYSKNDGRTYPVLYLLDGNAYFDAISGSVENFVRKKKIGNDPIVVGIGYENAYVMDSLRSRDYTYPVAVAADSFKISGLADKFYDFITTSIVARVDSMYRTDRNNRTIMGHSLGGYFVLYAMTRHLRGSTTFVNFIAASPSIYYGDNYLIREFGRAPDSKNIMKLYLTIGGLENGEGESENFHKLAAAIGDKADIRKKVYKNLEHMGTAIPTFEEGVRLFLK